MAESSCRVLFGICRRATLSIAALVPLLGAAASPDAPVVLENDALRLCFASAQDGYSITGVVNRLAGDVRFVDPDGKRDLFWALKFARKNPATGSNEYLRVSSRYHRGTDVVREGEKTTFCWRNLDVKGMEPGVLDVFARVKLPRGNAASEWTIRVVCRSREWGLYETTYPCFRCIADANEADILLPSNVYCGRLFRKTGFLPKNWLGANNPYPGYKMPFAAYNLGEAGLYFGVHDPDQYSKDFIWERPEYLRCATIVEHAGTPGKAGTGPKFPFVVQAYRGDWWDAAHIYRDFALKQKWARKGPMETRADYPKAMYEANLWVLCGYWSGYSRVLKEMATRWPDVNKAIEFTAWGYLPFDTAYPEYLPAKPDFAGICAEAKKYGILTMPYTNGMLWDTELPTFRAFGSKGAVRDANGAVRLEHWNHRNFAVMCPKWKPWQETLQVAPVTLIDKYGVTCVYMDQIACATGVPCFSTEHGHVPGSGTPFWVDGYRETLSAIHAETSKRGVPLTSEGLGEMFLDCFDGYLSAEMPRPEDVPLFPAVYSGYATVFGSNLGKYAGADSLFAVSARATIWGVAPGWNEAWIVDKGYEKHAEGLYACARVRQAASEFLARGFLERDVKFLEDPGTTPVAWSSKRGSKDLDVTGTMPAVMGTRWRNVAGTAEAVALVNVSGYAKTVSFRVADGGAFAALKLPGQPDASFEQEGSVVRLRILPHTFIVLTRKRTGGDAK